MPTKKIICSIVFFLSLFFLMQNKVYGAFQEVETNEETVKTGYEVFIDDTQELLSFQEIVSLEASMEKLVEYGNVVFITFSGNYSVSNEIARSIYHDLYGFESGIIVYEDTMYEQISVYFEGDCKKLVTNEQIKTIIRNTDESMKLHRYAESVIEIYDGINKAVETQIISGKIKVIYYMIMAIMISVVCCFLLLRYMTEHQKPSTEDLMWAANSHIRINHVETRRGMK